jgi:hypothetical protein
VSVRQVKLFPAVEADLVRSPLDSEHPAHVTVTTAERELEDPTQRVHRSCNHDWREEVGFIDNSLAAD